MSRDPSRSSFRNGQFREFFHERDHRHFSTSCWNQIVSRLSIPMNGRMPIKRLADLRVKTIEGTVCGQAARIIPYGPAML